MPWSNCSLFFFTDAATDVSETLGEKGRTMLRKLSGTVDVGRLANDDIKCQRVRAENYHFSLLCG